jgi:hypothetical protein
MGSGSHNHDMDWVGPLVLAAIVVTIIAAYFLIRLLAAALTAGVRIYAEHGFAGGRLARVLWWALAAMVGLLLLCGLAFLVLPATAAGDAALASWGFLAFGMTVAICGWKGQQRLGNPGVVDTYLPLGGQRAS